ncbi:hypothetical protein cypCar_00034630 [Cyprinus carpio]|nr:hypothetical protein cypCar_00034630 [Cyprinus carpio]
MSSSSLTWRTSTAWVNLNPTRTFICTCYKMIKFTEKSQNIIKQFDIMNCLAEYAVALYIYMHLLGYPAERISVLTTYNGQKHLIRDVINQRCANNSFFGQPSKVTTVDRFQGQQNNYIILSLVHTKA